MVVVDPGPRDRNIGARSTKRKIYKRQPPKQQNNKTTKQAKSPKEQQAGPSAAAAQPAPETNSQDTNNHDTSNEQNVPNKQGQKRHRSPSLQPEEEGQEEEGHEEGNKAAIHSEQQLQVDHRVHITRKESSGVQSDEHSAPQRPPPVPVPVGLAIRQVLAFAGQRHLGQHGT